MIALPEYSIFSEQCKAVVASAQTIDYNAPFRVGKLWMPLSWKAFLLFFACTPPCFGRMDEEPDEDDIYLFIF
jgi:hypothetical protein